MFRADAFKATRGSNMALGVQNGKGCHHRRADRGDDDSHDVGVRDNFGIAKNGLKLKSGALEVIVLWLLPLVVSGAVNVLFYKSIHAAGASSVLFVVIPLVVCLLVVFFVAPRRKQDASSGEIS